MALRTYEIPAYVQVEAATAEEAMDRAMDLSGRVDNMGTAVTLGIESESEPQDVTEERD